MWRVLFTDETNVWKYQFISNIQVKVLGLSQELRYIMTAPQCLWYVNPLFHICTFKIKVCVSVVLWNLAKIMNSHGAIKSQ